MAKSEDGLSALKLRVAPLRESIPRHTAMGVHSHLRRLIISGEIKAGTILSQAELARDLDVSRTPIREAMRMLQEEGLLQISPNQRARVATIDAQALEGLYCRRVFLECLAVRMTVPDLSSAELLRLRAAFDELCTDACRYNISHYMQQNSLFHDILTTGSGDYLIKDIRAAREMSGIYLSLVYTSRGENWWKRPELEHQAIVEACEARDAELAGLRTGHHLAQTAFELLQVFAPEYVPSRLHETLKMIGSEEIPAAEVVLSLAANGPAS